MKERSTHGQYVDSVYQRRVDYSTRAVLPPLFIVVMTFVLSGVIDPPGKEAFIFAIAVGTVFYWSVFRPASMGTTTVFIVGIIIELLNFSPPGLLLLTLLVVHGVAQMWRYGLSRINFILAWGLLSILALILSAVEWGVACMTMARAVPFGTVFFQAALTSGIYPVLATLFSWTRKIKLGEKNI